MAITKSITTSMGFTAPAAYIRITGFRGSKETISVDVVVHKDDQARVDNLQPITILLYELPLANGASMQDMYNALKALPEFDGAVDC